jgi:pyrimidine operon attenuation protein / uracil phosphoribosyltransferase
MGNKNKELFNTNGMSKLIWEIANAIIGYHKKELENVVLIGIVTAGYPIAQRIANIIKKETDRDLLVGKMDVALYRDDLLSRDTFVTIRETDIPFDVTGKHLILVDDVLFHGRTIRAALNGLLDFGRPATIELAVVVDRGHRELPIFANFIGDKIKTNKTDHIKINLLEVDGEDSILISSEKT